MFGVVTFYTMFHRDKHGRNELMVCTNISCMLRGGYEILHHIEEKLGIKPGQTTPDGAFTLVEEECLAACANAPMMICGQDYFLDLTPQKVDTILDDLRRRWREQQKSSPGGRPCTASGRRGSRRPRRRAESDATSCNPAAANLKIVTKNFGVADSHKLSVYQQRGGYAGVPQGADACSRRR